MRNQVSFKVSGKYALFTDPLTKIGGEKSTLHIPTYEALRGICDAVYFKPTFTWLVDQVRVLNPICTESKGMRPIKYNGGNDLSYYTYLRDVSYIVKAHFEFNLNRPELEADRNEDKHFIIAKRCIDRGGRRDVFLGTRECQAYVEPVTAEDDIGYYDDREELDFGLMYHSISYPEQNGEDKLYTLFWRPKMVKGIIKFCRPEECVKKVFLRDGKARVFNSTNFSGLNEKGLLEACVGLECDGK